MVVVGAQLTRAERRRGDVEAVLVFDDPGSKSGQLRGEGGDAVGLVSAQVGDARQARGGIGEDDKDAH